MRATLTAASGFKPATSGLILASLLAVALAGCKHADEPGGHVAGWTLVDPSQRHPIMVSQKPADLSVRVAAGSQGLSLGQKAQVASFLDRFQAAEGGSKLVIAVPSGAPNESAAMLAVGDLRHLVREAGLTEANVAVQAYRGGRDSSAPIRLSYLRYVAEGPECGRWSTNLAEDYRNLPYPNFGCAQQHNLAAQIANPADLIEPRDGDPADAERRTVVMGKYRKGQSTVSEKTGEEKAQVKGAQ
jgi:pilus assembly protein CpaD